MIDFLLPFLGLGEIFADFNFVLKLFVLITIVSFVKIHLGNSPLGLLLIAGITYFVFFAEHLWPLFGGIYIFYMMIMFGFSAVLIDWFFIVPHHMLPPAQQLPGTGPASSPVGTGKDVMQRPTAMRQMPPMMG